MSWFNLNDGLNNLKGQITNFASGVLTDGIVNDEGINNNNTYFHVAKGSHFICQQKT